MLEQSYLVIVINALCLYRVARAARANCVAFLPQICAHHDDVWACVGGSPSVGHRHADCEHALDVDVAGKNARGSMAKQ